MGATFYSDQLIGLSDKSYYAVRFWFSINVEIAFKIETENWKYLKQESKERRHWNVKNLKKSQTSQWICSLLSEESPVTNSSQLKFLIRSTSNSRWHDWLHISLCFVLLLILCARRHILSTVYWKVISNPADANVINNVRWKRISKSFEFVSWECQEVFSKSFKGKNQKIAICFWKLSKIHRTTIENEVLHLSLLCSNFNCFYLCSNHTRNPNRSE